MDVEMGDMSLPHTSGNKRAAMGSPSITPPGHVDDAQPGRLLDGAVDDSDMCLKPARLEVKFNDLSSLMKPDWATPAARTSGETTPFPTGGYVPYKFDDEDAETVQ
jgi:hypothetical protein